MARPIYQYKPIDDNDVALGVLLPFNKDAKGKSNSADYKATSNTGKGVFESSYTTQEAVISNLKNLRGTLRQTLVWRLNVLRSQK